MMEIKKEQLITLCSKVDYIDYDSFPFSFKVIDKINNKTKRYQIGLFKLDGFFEMQYLVELDEADVAIKIIDIQDPDDMKYEDICLMIENCCLNIDKYEIELYNEDDSFNGCYYNEEILNNLNSLPDKIMIYNINEDKNIEYDGWIAKQIIAEKLYNWKDFIN